jgi:two-component SAPR family response regulator
MGLENSTCDRCKEEVSTLKGSYFNTEMICLECDSRERAHSMFEMAKKIENEQVKQGNYNFEGIGLPIDIYYKTK